MEGYGSNGRCMVTIEGVWYQWKVYGSNGRYNGRSMVAMEGYGSNGRCMVTMEGVWYQWKVYGSNRRYN